MKGTKLKNILFLQAVLILYSMASVCSKIASGYEFLSTGFILWYGLVIVCLGIYAILWQQVLKRMPLTTAFANKAVTIIW
ncbi:MAG: transporter, partial [Eubacteriaceae bacterium]